jgi:hypothetical protein
MNNDNGDGTVIWLRTSRALQYMVTMFLFP